jgi:hypothetical protein
MPVKVEFLQLRLAAGREVHAAKWISDTIGEVGIERMRESRSKGRTGNAASAWNGRWSRR